MTSDTDVVLSRRGDDLCFGVWVKPKASRSRVIGVKQGCLVVAITAPPVEGAANQALSVFLAKLLGTRPSAVSLIAGQASRQKRFCVSGVSEARFRERLARLV